MDRRRFVTYLGAGAIVVAAAAAGGYYAGQRPPTVTPTTTAVAPTTVTVVGPTAPTWAPTTFEGYKNLYDVPVPMPYPYKAPPGTNITIAVLAAGTRGVISGPIYYMRDSWSAMTGATVTAVDIAFSDLFTKFFTDVVTGAGKFDAFITGGNWYGDLIKGGYIVPITDYLGPDFHTMKTVSRSTNTGNNHVQWYPPGTESDLRHEELLKWGKDWYGCAMDQDGIMFYYRKDVVNNEDNKKKFEKEYGYTYEMDVNKPNNDIWWDNQMADILQFYNNVHDLPFRGNPPVQYASSISFARGFLSWMYWIVLAGVMNVIPGPTVDRYHNMFFWDPETMEPTINNEGCVKSLEFYVDKIIPTAPKEAMGWLLGESFDGMLSGNAAFSWNFGDIGRMASDPSTSKIKGKVGVRLMPGAMNIYDREKGQWSKLDTPNYVANIMGCSWHGVISKFSKNPEACYDFFSYIAYPYNHFRLKAKGWSGYDPGRKFDFLPPNGTADVQAYVYEGWDEGDAKAYMEGVWECYYAPKTYQIFPRIPGMRRFEETMDVRIAMAAAGTSSPKDSLDGLAKDWNAIIDDIGRTDMIKAFQTDVGYGKPYTKGIPWA
jgi:multiple sugar transport system substrate-binding protein